MIKAERANALDAIKAVDSSSKLEMEPVIFLWCG